MTRRHTVQRALVLSTVNQLHCHATADEIYLAIHPTHPTISKATVYRNLNLLAEMGDIRKIELPGEVDRFDHLTYEHYHVRCEKCGRIFDVDMDAIPDLEGLIKDKHGFAFTGHEIFFKGICPACQASQKK